MKKLLIAGRGETYLSSVSAAQAGPAQDIEKRGVIRIAVPQTFHRSARWVPTCSRRVTSMALSGEIDEAQAAAGPVTSANRVPYLQTDKVDGDFQPRQERQAREVIDFAAPTPTVLPPRVFGPGRS